MNQKAIYGIIGVVLLGAIIYFTVNKKAEQPNNQQSSTNNSVTPQPLNQTFPPTPAPAKPTTARSKTLVDFEKIKAGDTFGDMVVVSVKPVRENMTQLPASENIIIHFQGAVEITGKYAYYDDNAYFGAMVCFSKLDRQSLNKMPILTAVEASESAISEFCFDNQDYAETLFAPKGSSGDATIIIDNYVFISYPTEGWNSAKLIKVISKS